MSAKATLARFGLKIPAAMLLTLGAGSNVVIDTATGSQIGTGSTQKLGFFGATPVVQPAGTTDLRTALINLGLYASGGASPLNLNGGALTAASVTDSGLTSGRIPVAGTAGLIGDFSTLTYASGSGISVDGVTIADAKNIAVGTGTGTQIGTSTSQKLGFLGATPVVQQGSTTDLRTLLITFGFLATGGASPLNLNGGALTAGSVTNSGLTSGRVPVAGTAGLIGDFSAFTYANGSGISVDGVTLADAKNLAVGTGTGSQIGTSTSQKLGFFGATPVAQQANTTDLRTLLINLGFLASGGASPLNLNGGALTAASAALGTVSASGQITSTVATGSAPLVVASTTNVANLNAASVNGSTFTSPTGLVNQFCWMVESPTAKTYTICYKSEFALTINEVIIALTSGTCTATFRIDGTIITGLSSLAVTSTFQTAVASALNALAAGSTLTMDITSPSSAVDLVVTVKTTR